MAGSYRESSSNYRRVSHNGIVIGSDAAKADFLAHSVAPEAMYAMRLQHQETFRAALPGMRDGVAEGNGEAK